LQRKEFSIKREDDIGPWKTLFLLFVQENSSPTIKVERKNSKDVYISFQSSNKTEELYLQLKQKIMQDSESD